MYGHRGRRVARRVKFQQPPISAVAIDFTGNCVNPRNERGQEGAAIASWREVGFQRVGGCDDGARLVVWKREDGGPAHFYGTRSSGEKGHTSVRSAAITR